MRPILLLLGVAAALAACTEKPQSGPSARKVDTKAWESAQTAYTAPGWKPGDQASWESQMRNRAANQNEYPRTSK